EVADDEHHAMPELLEVLHLADDNGVAEVDVRGGGIEPDLDGDRLPARDLRLQIVALNEVDRALCQEVELFVDGHARRIVVTPREAIVSVEKPANSSSRVIWRCAA